VKIEIRWRPSHQGIEGSEVADGWAKLAADEPDAHGVEWFSTTNPDASVSERKFHLPRSLANAKRGFSEQKWAHPKGWARKQLARAGNREYRPCERQKPDPTVAKANKRLTSRFYQLKSGHCLTGQYLAWTTRRPYATHWWCQYSIQTREHLFKNRPDGGTRRRPSGRPSWKRRECFPAPPGAGPYKSRSCSLTSGAARRTRLSRKHTSAGRPAHRWQEGKTERLVRPLGGRRESGKIGWRR